MRSDDLQGIIPFVHVVEAGSFTLAAERLRLTTSAVGKSVAQMERRLGVRLLNRSTRSLSLTPEGESYFKACKSALSEIDAAQAQLASNLIAPSGTLKIDMPIALGRRCIAPVLFNLVRDYPELRLEASFNDRQVDLVEEGFDLSVRVGELADEAGLIARKLFVQRSIVCAAPSYIAKWGSPEGLEDLKNHRLVVYGRSGFVTPWTLRDSSGTLRTITPRGHIVLGHGDPLLDATLEGLGIAYLPTWLVHERLRDGKIVAIWPGEFVQNRPVHALWPKTRTPTPKVRAVVDALVGVLSPPPWDDF